MFKTCNDKGPNPQCRPRTTFRQVSSNNTLQRKLSQYDGRYTHLSMVLEEDNSPLLQSNSPCPHPGRPASDEVDRTSTPQRRKSAKDLIHRYENMSFPVVAENPLNDLSFGSKHRSTSIPSNAPFTLLSYDKPVPLPPTNPELKDQDLPSRRSLKSLFGALAKKASNTSFNPSRGSASSRKTSMPGSTGRLYPLGLSSSSSVMYSGPVLYLSESQGALQASARHLLPVWSVCKMALHATHIVLSSVSARGTPEILTLSLTGCTDVRSLTRSDMDQDEWAMLPSSVDGADGDEGEPKVFAVVFEGRPGGTFAARSVKERACWVSAIWSAMYVILLHCLALTACTCQGGRTTLQ